MLQFAFLMLILAVIAAVLGFGGIVGEFVWLAHVALVVFLVLFVISLLSGALRGRTPPA